MSNKKIQKRIESVSSGNRELKEALEQLYYGSDIFFVEIVLKELERLNYENDILWTK
jgi:hypothetical protein